MSIVSIEEDLQSFSQCIKTTADYPIRSEQVIEAYFEGEKSQKIISLINLIEGELSNTKSEPLVKCLSLLLLRDIIIKKTSKVPYCIAKQKSVLQRLHDIVVGKDTSNSNLKDTRDLKQVLEGKCVQIAVECICLLKLKFGEDDSKPAEVFRRLHRSLSKTGIEIPKQFEQQTSSQEQIIGTLTLESIIADINALARSKNQEKVTGGFKGEVKNEVAQPKKFVDFLKEAQKLFNKYKQNKSILAEILVSAKGNWQEWFLKAREVSSELELELGRVSTKLKLSTNTSADEKKLSDGIKEEQKKLTEMRSLLNKDSPNRQREISDAAEAYFGKKFKLEEKSSLQSLVFHLNGGHGNESFSGQALHSPDKQKQLTGGPSSKSSNGSKNSPNIAVRGSNTPMFKFNFNEGFHESNQNSEPNKLSPAIYRPEVQPINNFSKFGSTGASKSSSIVSKYDPELSETSIKRLLKTDKEIHKSLEKIQNGIIASFQIKQKPVPAKMYDSFEHSKQQVYSHSAKNSLLSDSFSPEKSLGMKTTDITNKLTTQKTTNNKILSYPSVHDDYFAKTQPNFLGSKLNNARNTNGVFEGRMKQESTTSILRNTAVRSHMASPTNSTTRPFTSFFKNKPNHVGVPLQKPVKPQEPTSNNSLQTSCELQKSNLDSQTANEIGVIQGHGDFGLLPIKKVLTLNESNLRVRIQESGKRISPSVKFQDDSDNSANECFESAVNRKSVLKGSDSNLSKGPRFPVVKNRTLVSPFIPNSRSRANRNLKTVTAAPVFSKLEELVHAPGIESIDQFCKIACYKNGTLYRDEYFTIEVTYTAVRDQNEGNMCLRVSLVIKNNTDKDITNFRITFLTDQHLDYAKLPATIDPCVNANSQTRIEFYISVSDLPFTYLPLKCGGKVLKGRVIDLKAEFILPVTYNMFMNVHEQIPIEDFLSYWKAAKTVLRSEPLLLAYSFIKTAEDFGKVLGDLTVNPEFFEGVFKAYSIFGRFSLEGEQEEYLLRINWVPESRGIVFEVGSYREESSEQAEFILQTLQFLFCRNTTM